jgi:hypothetical protein
MKGDRQRKILVRQCNTLRQEVTLLSTLYLLCITIGNAS